MNSKISIFEKNPKLFTVIFSSIILAITVLILAFILNLNLIEDYAGGEKYSIADKIKYSIRCNNSRNIKLRENSPNKIRYLLPNSKHETLEHKEYIIETDHDGFIKPSFIHENPDLKIFFIGGSTTECEMVDEEFRFPYLVGRLLEEKTEVKINSENSARSGNNSLHSINIVLNKILPYDPDIIVMMHNVNDLSTLLDEGTYWNDNKSKSPLVCTHKNTKKLKRKNEWANSNWHKIVVNSKEEQEKLIEKYKNNLKLFVNIAKSQNIVPILMTQPNRIENNKDFKTGKGKDFDIIYQNLYIRFNQEIRDFGKKNNVLVIDLANNTPNTKEYIYDQVHVNKKGSIANAKKIVKDIYPYINNIINNK